ncbi:unnamed protein product [Diabrotica balteata]|uniref:Gag-like protein n=1 Tax=Diabrotica balteata TaxID=107213 RepID=A0A9N9X9X8_DIABA|nr:unnamed protein product [Diabrotica balteata]
MIEFDVELDKTPLTANENAIKTAKQQGTTENTGASTENTTRIARQGTTENTSIINDGSVTLYITSCENETPDLCIQKLKTVFPKLNVTSTVQTEYGLIINLQNDTFLQKVLQMDLAKIFGGPVQAVSLYSGQYKKIVRFKEIPWCIRNEEIENCLKRQGVSYSKLTRKKSTLYVEVSDFTNYQRLREEGINFYDSVVLPSSEDGGINEEIYCNNTNIIQCYKCQGFWHKANTCKQSIRCVRCGEEHLVEHCDRPKSSPICCNCKGPHHAAYKLCPVRLKLQKSVRVSFTFEQ